MAQPDEFKLEILPFSSLPKDSTEFSRGVPGDEKTQTELSGHPEQRKSIFIPLKGKNHTPNDDLADSKHGFKHCSRGIHRST